MRFLTGGFAIWMGGWTTQVHHHRDIIGCYPGALEREVAYCLRCRDFSTRFEEDLRILSPAAALADGLLHQDHDLVPPEDIDPDYLETPQVQAVLEALEVLGATRQDAEVLIEPYRLRLQPDDAGISLSGQ
jgi:hypothetical protein